MLHQGGLSGAGMADYPYKLSLFHGKGHILQGNMLKGRSRAVYMG
jgi:hypothetical protein